MNTGILTLRKRWPALAAIAVLLAVALTAGTLFAANTRPQAELPAQVEQQSVVDAVDPVAAAEPPAVPPAPERVPAQAADNDEEAADLPPVDKTPPQYPNLDSNLNRLVEEAETVAQQDPGQLPSTTDGVGGVAASADEPVLVTFYIEPDQIAAVRQFLEDNDVFVRNAGEDYIEAHVPPALLGAASELPGVRRGGYRHPAPAPKLGGRGQPGCGAASGRRLAQDGLPGPRTSRSALSTAAFKDSAKCEAANCLENVDGPMLFRCRSSPGPQASSLADCEQAPCEEIACNHGTAVAETLVDVAPEVELYIANPMSRGDLRDAADWMAQQGVQVVNMSLGWLVDGPGDGTSPSVPALSKLSMPRYPAESPG